MEGTSGTVMTAGTAVNVGPAVSRVSSEASMASNKAEGNSTPEVKAVDAKPSLKLVEPVKADADQADRLIDVAKTKGVDKAFEELAGGDEEDKEVHADKETIDRKDGSPDVQTLEKSPMTLRAQVTALNEKVDRLFEDNKGIVEQMGKTSEVNQAAFMSIYELASALKQLIEEDLNKEEKDDLLTILIKIMAKMMGAMFAPQEGDGVVAGQSNEERLLEKMAA